MLKKRGYTLPNPEMRWVRYANSWCLEFPHIYDDKWIKSAVLVEVTIKEIKNGKHKSEKLPIDNN